MLLYYYDIDDTYDALVSVLLVQVHLVCLFNVKLPIYQTRESHIKIYSIIYNLYSYFVIIYGMKFLKFTEARKIIGL